MKWHTEQRKINDLIPSDNNPRQLTEKQHKDLEKSLKKFDLVEIPAVNVDGQILAGHMRLKILQQLGRGDEIIDVRVPDKKLSKKDCDEYIVRSNKNTGEWDLDKLSINFDISELKEWGFEDFDFSKIEVFGDTSTDREKQGVNSTWDQVKTSDFVKIIIGDFESSINKEVARKIITYCEIEYENANTPIKESLKTILESGCNNV